MPDTTNPTQSYEITHVPAALIDPGPNDRKSFNPVELAELAGSIKEHGLAQPPMVRPMPTGRYEIVAGERRTRAMKDVLGWSEIPVIVRELDDESASAIMLIENVQRADLNPIEESEAYLSRMERFGWSMAEVARRAQVSEGRVKARVELAKLIPDIRKLIADGHFPVGFGPILAPLDANRQLIAFRWIREQPTLPTVKALETYAGKLLEEQQQQAMFDLTIFDVPAVAQAVNEAAGKLSALLPEVDGLPKLPVRLGGIAVILDAYITELMEADEQDAARIMMDFWRKLMLANYAVISPYDSKLMERFGAVLVGQEQ